MGEVKRERKSGRGRVGGRVGETKWERPSGRGGGERPCGRNRERGQVGEAEWEKPSGRGRITPSLAHILSIGLYGLTSQLIGR